MNLTIIIPTKNRVSQILKTIKYYNNFFSGYLYILDSSPKRKFNVIKKEIKKINNKKIKCLNLKGGPIEVISFVKNKIKTEYSCNAGDDDLYSINGLKKIIKFLDNNKKYIGAFGYNLIIEKKFNRFFLSEYTGLKEINFQNPIKRINSLLGPKYTPIFQAVTRTKNYINALKFINKKKCPHDIFIKEILFSSLLTIQGNFKKKSNFFLLRQVGHKRNVLKKNYFNKEAIKSACYTIDSLKKIANLKTLGDINAEKLLNYLNKKKNNKYSFIFKFINTYFYFWIKNFIRPNYFNNKNNFYLKKKFLEFNKMSKYLN